VVTRILHRGQVIWQNQYVRPPPKPLDFERVVVPPDESEPVELRSGGVYYDPEEDLAYRIVRSGICRAEDGWATFDYWMRHFKGIGVSTLQQMIRRGLFDAAIEEGSPTKRYRLRSEVKAREWLEEYKKYRLRKKRG